MSSDKYRMVPLKHAGERAPCSRCAAPCRVASEANEAARVGRHADGQGVCANCAATIFLRTEMDIEYLLPPGTEVTEALRARHVQEGFSKMLRAGNADMGAFEIDWEQVITNWELPLGGGKRKRRETRASPGLFD